MLLSYNSTHTRSVQDESLRSDKNQQTLTEIPCRRNRTTGDPARRTGRHATGFTLPDMGLTGLFIHAPLWFWQQITHGQRRHDRRAKANSCGCGA